MLKEIKSLQHPLVKHLVKIRQNHDYRFEHRAVVIEGIKPIHEICQIHSFKTLLVSDPTLIPKNLSLKETYLVSEQIMQKASGMVHPEGILAEVSMPQFDTLKGKKLVLALDGVSDPGNVGNLLRSALALRWEGAFILESSCDPFNEKALRASRGAIFRLPIRIGSWDELERLITENQLTPYVADLEGVSIKKIDKFKRGLLVMGNEAHGPSKKALELCKKITIPMAEGMESLNVSVAGGILMFLMNENR